MKYRGIIFDFNGTLFLDSEKHMEAWRAFSKKLRGTSFTDEEMRDHMFGRTNEDIIAYAIGKKPDKALVEKCTREKEAIYRQMCRDDMEHFVLTDGAVEFLDYLKAHNIPRTIATMSEKVNVDFFIEGFHLARWFDLEKIVYDNGKIPGKPAPDIYEIAAKNLNLSPSECIVVEDAVSGIAAAKNAGIGKIIAIGPREKHEFLMSLEGVTETITNFYEFNREVLYENN